VQQQPKLDNDNTTAKGAKNVKKKYNTFTTNMLKSSSTAHEIEAKKK